MNLGFKCPHGKPSLHGFSSYKTKISSRSSDEQSRQISVFHWLSFPQRSAFERLTFWSKPSSPKDPKIQNSNLQSNGPTGFRTTTTACLNGTCKRFLSPYHLRIDCKQGIKCWHCKQEGHVQRHCSIFTTPRKLIIIHGEESLAAFDPIIV
jgi:hypothetical protein